jgi:hypothetical protein
MTQVLDHSSGRDDSLRVDAAFSGTRIGQLLLQSEPLDPAGLTAWPGFDLSSVAKARTTPFGLIFI